MFSRTVHQLRPAVAVALSALSHASRARIASVVHYSSTSTRSLSGALHNSHLTIHNCVPCRHKKTSSNKNADSDGEDDWDSEDRSLNKDSKVMKFKAPSMRMDLILRSALGIARNKIEKIFYDSKIRVNGKKVLKKSIQVRVGDEIDIVKGFSPKNPDHIVVSRVEILDVAAVQSSDEEEAISISLRRFKSLLIENYAQDPFKQSTADTN